MEAKEEVDGVLGALGEAQDPRVCVPANEPLAGGKTSGGAWGCPHGQVNLDPAYEVT